jgi:hypothetical protein
MTNEPELNLDQAKEVIDATAIHPRVTEASIKAKIAKIDYLKHDHMTICIVTMTNGFMVIGQSAPADIRNYNEQVGLTYAYENAFKQLWVLEGYLLRDKLYIDNLRGDGLKSAG